ncbi:MAG: metallophosphoesterase family protein [candidate division WOR-3 bacterium]
MRFCIIADVHGNLEALLAVSEKIKSYGKNIDKIMCLGDIVGYGADPSECIRITSEISDVILAGNHDFAVCELTSIEDFNNYAKEAVLWSRQQLDKKEIDFLKGLPFTHSERDMDFAHSSLHRPESWRYLSGTPDTYIDFQIMEKNLLFVGHTHVPVIFENSGVQVKRINLLILHLLQKMS